MEVFMFSRILGVGIIALAMLSCNEVTNPISPAKPLTTSHFVPASLSLVPMSGLGKAAIISGIAGLKNSSDSMSFDLGGIKASRDFYFEIRNTGTVDVTNIEIASSNPQFTISPQTLAVLRPQDSSQVSMILRVSTVHGVALDGTGFTEVMNAGTNTSQVSLSGQTRDANDAPVAASASATLKVNAKLLDIKLLASTGVVDLTKPVMHGNSSLGGLGWLPMYYCPGSAATMVNTGNVAIRYTYFIQDVAISAPGTLDVGDTLVVPASMYSTNGNCTIGLDGNNTIADHNKFTIGNDGSVYLFTINYPPPSNPVPTDTTGG
jgi:hypothetical protein